MSKFNDYFSERNKKRQEALSQGKWRLEHFVEYQTSIRTSLPDMLSLIDDLSVKGEIIIEESVLDHLNEARQVASGKKKYFETIGPFCRPE